MQQKRRGPVVAFLVVLASWPLAGSPGQEAPFASLKETKPFTYVCLPHQGPIADIGVVIGQFMQAMQGQNLFAGIRGPMIGVYYDSPADVRPADLRWEVGFPVAEGTAPQPPLVRKEWKFSKTAVAVHKGPYAKAGETMAKLMAWIKEKGYVVCGPSLERYLNNPMQVKPEELLTEIWIPVREK